MLEKLFKLRENGTNVRTEVMAGITTFMTMAYILAVNPSILSSTGMNPTAVLLATCLASFLGTMCMGMMANLPFALSAGMGLNAFFAYTVCGNMGYPWQVALLAVFVEGLIFIVLSLTNVREALFNVIPMSLKKAVSVGIGVYIAFIGLQNAGVVVNSDSTLVTIVSFRDNFQTGGICALLAILGTLFTAFLYIKRVKGSILIGILSTWVLGIICQLTGLYTVDVEAGYNSLIPAFSMTDFTALGSTFGQCFKFDFDGVSIINFIVVIFSFLFVGAIVGLCGWHWGFAGSAVAGAIGIAIIIALLHDSPESKGLPPIEVLTGEEKSEEHKARSTRKMQRTAVRNPLVWMLALSSACMYVARYAVNGWGVLFLQEVKGFTLVEASQIVSVNALLGIFGAVCCGWLTDRFLHGRRNVLAFIVGLINTAALCLFFFSGSGMSINILSMVLFGTTIGILICFLGGLMAIDIVPREATGAALGIVGMASYVGAGLQDIVSGWLINSGKTELDGVTSYNFDSAIVFWIAASAVSFILALFVAKRSHR